MLLKQFSANWCQPCTILSNALRDVDEPLIKNREKVDITTDYGMEQAKKYGVRSIPTLIIVDSEGYESRRLTGSVSKERVIDFVSSVTV